MYLCEWVTIFLPTTFLLNKIVWFENPIFNLKTTLFHERKKNHTNKVNNFMSDGCIFNEPYSVKYNGRKGFMNI